MAQLVLDGSTIRLHDHFMKFREELAVKLRDKAVETGRDSQPGDHVQGDRQQHVGEPDAMSSSIATALAMSDETLVDVAPSPPRSRLQAGGQRMVGLLVVRPGVLAG
jgi:hypothetical protein